MSEKGDLVRRLFRAVEARDIEEVVACYADDVEIHEAASLPYGGIYRGRDGARRHWERVAGAWRPFSTGLDPRLDPVFIEGDGDSVAVVFRARGIDPSGARFDAPEVAVYEIRDGRIVRSQMFHADAEAVSEFLGRGRAAGASSGRGEAAMPEDSEPWLTG